MLISIFLTFMFISFACTQDYISTSMEGSSTLCDSDERMGYGCIREVTQSKSFVHCGSLCAFDESCMGVSSNEKGTCFHHFECPMISECITLSNVHMYLSKHCVNGRWDESIGSCKCLTGFHGARCNQCYPNCKALSKAGYPRGFYRVYLDPEQDGKNLFQVVCYSSLLRYTSLYLLRNEGRMDFNRSWAEYLQGFFYDENNFMTGLHSWYKASEMGCKTLVLAFQIDGTRYQTIYRIFYGFKISNMDTKFRFTYDRSSLHRMHSPPNACKLDCLESLQNKSFSTYDNDDDGDARNCASRAGFGWWFSGCDNDCNAPGLGFEHWDDKPDYQLFTLKGWDITPAPGDTGLYKMYVKC